MFSSVPLQFKPVKKVTPCSSLFQDEVTAIEPIKHYYHYELLITNYDIITRYSNIILP